MNISRNQSKCDRTEGRENDSEQDAFGLSLAAEWFSCSISEVVRTQSVFPDSQRHSIEKYSLLRLKIITANQ